MHDTMDKSKPSAQTAEQGHLADHGSFHRKEEKGNLQRIRMKNDIDFSTSLETRI